MIDKEKSLTGDAISMIVHDVGKYTYSIMFLDRRDGDYIIEKEVMSQSAYNEIINDLTMILTVTDFRIGAACPTSVPQMSMPLLTKSS